MYTDSKKDITNREIKELDNQIHENVREQRILEECDSELFTLLSTHNDIVLDLSETWQDGEMLQLLEDTDYELRESVHRLFNDIEEEKDVLQKEKSKLEELQDELYMERNKAMEGDGYEY